MGNERVQPTNYDQMVSLSNRRIARQERRPQVTSGADLLGPGFGPTATQIDDWADDAASFTGFFWSQTGAVNTPDPTKAWIGVVISSDDRLGGVQRVWRYLEPGRPKEWVRTWSTDGAGNRVFGGWVGEGDWQLTGCVAPTGVNAPTIVTQTWKLDRTTAALYLRVQFNASMVVSADGNMIDTVVATVPSVIAPNTCPIHQNIGVGLRAGSAYILSTGDVVLSAVAPNFPINAGTQLDIGSVYLL